MESLKAGLRGTDKMVEPERWKKIKGFENRYLISNYGSVYSLYFGKRMSLYKTDAGRHSVNLTVNYSNKGFLVARLVGLHFIENPQNKPEINHKNGIKDDDFYKNLEWVTRSENIQHGHDTGLYNRRNENHPRSKFTNNEVKKIREVYDNSDITQQELADEYNVSRTAINGVVNYQNYKDI